MLRVRAGFRATARLLNTVATSGKPSHAQSRRSVCSDTCSDSKVGSEHGGSPFQGTFAEAHILAITQPICDEDDFILAYMRDLNTVVGHGDNSRREVAAGVDPLGRA